MQLSKFSDYSLRVLMYLALRPDRQTPVRDIAVAYGVSRHHLVKVAGKLTELGFVDATRGRTGGLQLAMAPADIVIGAVVRKTENLGLVECMTEAGSCVLADACQLQRALGQARDAFLAELDRHTLADLIKPKRTMLARLLNAPDR